MLLRLSRGSTSEIEGEREPDRLRRSVYDAVIRKLHGTASADVPAPLDECFAVLEAVDQYPAWYPEVVRDAEVLGRGPGGQPNRVRAKLHVKRGPVAKDFDLVLAVESDRPGTVKLSRVANDRSEQRFDVTWRLRDGVATHIELDLYAELRVSRFVPLGGIGNSIAKGFITAAGKAVASRSGL